MYYRLLIQSTKGLTITDYDDNKGILPIQTGNARIVNSYSRILHVINLDNYEYNIVNIGKSINALRKTIPAKNEPFFREQLKITTNKFKNLLDNFNHLKPIKARVRRGLINGLGNIIKAITGNLDQEDFEEIGKNLEKLNRNEELIKEQNEKQIKLNKGMIDRFNEIQKFVGDQTKSVEFSIRSLENVTHNSLTIIQINHNLNSINYNIEVMNEHILNIEDAIGLSKQKVISRHILNNHEIDIIKTELIKYNVKFISDEYIFEIINIQAYFNNTQLIFSIKIPTFHPEIYNHYNLYPLPLNYTYIIEIPYPNMILNEHNYYFLINQCTDIEGIKYCRNKEITKIRSCIPDIIQNIPTKCTLIKKEIQDEIKELTPGNIYVQSKNEVTLKTTCRQHLYRGRSIKGVKLLQYQNCSVIINGTTFDTTSIQIQEDLQILQPYNDVNITNIFQEVSLPELREKTLQNIEDIHLLHAKTSHQHYHNYTIYIIIITIISIIIYIYITRKCCQKKPTSSIEVDNSSDPVYQKPKRLWSTLRGEELRPMTSPTTTTTT